MSVAIAIVLWVTLISRIGTNSRDILLPFWSYKAIFNGNRAILLENFGNILLFLPVGLAIAFFSKLTVKESLFVGFSLSLLIEISQYYFCLGSFEFDDLFHNTLGSCVGAVLVIKLNLRKTFGLGNRIKSLVVLVSLDVLIISSIVGYNGVGYQKMKSMARMNDRADGAKNLLVPIPNPVYVEENGVSVHYNSDGSMLIEGTSNKRSWIVISRFNLNSGYYYMEGLSGVSKETVGLELAVYDYDQHKYVMLGHEVGVVDRLSFFLQETSKMEVLISIYPGWTGRLLARPVIFQEDY